MRINCFRGARSFDTAVEETPRPVIARLRRTATSQSTTSRGSTGSNSSISSLPPCKRLSQAAEAMLMPVPPEPRPSRCLRLSQPKTYSDIVDSMKKSKGCRDWRNFDVFDELEIDMSVSAVDRAEKRAADYEKRLRKFGRTASNQEVAPFVNMIG